MVKLCKRCDNGVKLANTKGITNAFTKPVKTKRLIIRAFTMEDLTAFFSIMNDEEVNVFLPWYTVKNMSEAKELLERRYIPGNNRESASRLAVCLKTDNNPIGYVSVSSSGSYDFGYALKKDFWNQGYAAEAAQAAAFMLKNNGYPFITATHDVNNPASGAVMKKIGMKYCYSYVEQWQPKDISVTFRMYQLNFDGNEGRVYMGYWDKYPLHFIEPDV